MKTPLVMIPGMMCDARLWAPQVAAFSAGRSVVLADISTAETMEDLAAGILRDAPERFALAGLSMGGIVAMEVLRQAPHRVERLALLDTNHRAELDEVKSNRLPQIAAVKAGRLAEVMREEMKPRYLGYGARRADILALCMDMALDLGPEVFLRQSAALMARPDQTLVLRITRVPTLVLCGSGDVLCPVSRHQEMAAMVQNATLEVIEGAGHLPPLERPNLTNAAMERWLEET